MVKNHHCAGGFSLKQWAIDSDGVIIGKNKNMYFSGYELKTTTFAIF